MPSGTEYLTVKAAAEFLGVCPNTIRNWSRDAKLQEYRHPLNNYRLYKKSDLEKLVEQLRKPVRVNSRRRSSR